ncbi:MAG: S-adenosylmethionine:tRNA ribosyltransferase-isomerase [Bacteroidales bacterium]|nr:S-adenosylmethionine:tRNA ribosyltransferase-isomerase [Bacteroidales bacterium]
MRKPDNIPITNFDYDLPVERIAKYPLEVRDRSRLLVYDNGSISSHVFQDAPSLLQKGDQLYFNVTRVVQARLMFRKATGGRIEIFILEPHDPAEHQLAFSSTEPVTFTCLVGNAKKWKQGSLRMEVGAIVLEATQVERHDDTFIIRFSWNDRGISFGAILAQAGSTPIPPYLDREAEDQDAVTYQTVYARQDGSVAAPTAGLHFTERVLGALDKRGVQRYDLTLHVGAGTFIPVKEENAVDHAMHDELVTVERVLLESLLGDQRIIAVGTTSTRTLESLYWLGVRAHEDTSFSFEQLYLDQWDAYLSRGELTLEESVRVLLERMESAGLDTFSFRTRIMITPGYEFKVIDGLFTNFHQPKSTLLLLIAALVGDDWKRIYDFALENGYRFLSYGDGSLLIPER